ncbi:hypothetical protein PR202_gb29122 [Eleusine coracana subsp. coracana]|uniref:Retrotransposon gag domain-containing protein n=1 Tax=Eleusine coracana subsp. coracana TaxID=191504 RepID=A0AAV5FZ83_ELECO|nr:hypothetical protein PR202_gb29122 [Eleusine coracana subsp. coracana]
MAKNPIIQYSPYFKISFGSLDFTVSDNEALGLENHRSDSAAAISMARSPSSSSMIPMLVPLGSEEKDPSFGNDSKSDRSFDEDSVGSAYPYPHTVNMVDIADITDGDQDGDQDGEHEGNPVDGHPNQLAEGGQQEEDPPADDLSVGHRRRPRGLCGSCNACRLDFGPELEVDGIKVYHTPQNNITGAKILLDTLMVDANYQTPAMQKAVAMLKAAVAQEATKSQSLTSSSHVSSRGRHRHEDLRNSLCLRDRRDTINSHYEERAQDNRRYEEERRDWRTDDQRDDHQDPPPRHNRDDRHQRDNRDRRDNDDNDHRRCRHDDDVGPRHSLRATPSPDWHRRSMTPTDDEINGIKAYIPRLHIARWPKGFKSVPIEKYNGQTNPREWLQLYSTAIRSARGDSYLIANYLPICLDPAVRIWLTSIPEESITSWGDLNRKLIEIFQATCNRPGNHFDLTRIKQKTNEPLHDYIK